MTRDCRTRRRGLYSSSKFTKYEFKSRSLGFNISGVHAWSDKNQLKYQRREAEKKSIAELSRIIKLYSGSRSIGQSGINSARCSFMKSKSREIFVVSDLIKLNAQYITTSDCNNFEAVKLFSALL